MASTAKKQMRFIPMSLLVPLIIFQTTLATSRSSDHFTNSKNDFRQVCVRTTHQDVCISIISDDPRADLKTNPAGFCNILNDKAKTVAADILNKINAHLGGSRSISPPIKTLLQDAYACISDADFVVYNLYFSTLSWQTYPDLKSGLEEAIRNVTQSEAFLSNLPTDLLPLATQNGYLASVVETTLEIVNIVVCDKIESCTA